MPHLITLSCLELSESDEHLLHSWVALLEENMPQEWRFLDQGKGEVIFVDIDSDRGMAIWDAASSDIGSLYVALTESKEKAKAMSGLCLAKPIRRTALEALMRKLVTRLGKEAVPPAGAESETTAHETTIYPTTDSGERQNVTRLLLATLGGGVVSVLLVAFLVFAPFRDPDSERQPVVTAPPSTIPVWEDPDYRKTIGPLTAENAAMGADSAEMELGEVTHAPVDTSAADEAGDQTIQKDQAQPLSEPEAEDEGSSSENASNVVEDQSRIEEERQKQAREARLEKERQEQAKAAQIEAERREQARLAELEAARISREQARLARIEAERARARQARIEAEERERRRLARLAAEEQERLRKSESEAQARAQATPRALPPAPEQGTQPEPLTVSGGHADDEYEFKSNPCAGPAAKFMSTCK